MGYAHKCVLSIAQIPVVIVTLVLGRLVQFSWLAVTETEYRCSQRSWDKVQLAEVVLQVRLCLFSPTAMTWYVSATGEGLHDTQALSSSQDTRAATFVGGHGSRKSAVRMNLSSEAFKNPVCNEGKERKSGLTRAYSVRWTPQTAALV